MSLHDASDDQTRITRVLVRDSRQVLQPGPMDLPPAFALQPDLQGPLVHSVWLQSTGGNDLAVARVLRDMLGLGLAEATQLAGRAPVLLRSGLDQAAADALAAQLRGAGAVAPTRGTPTDPKVGLQVQLPVEPVVNGAEVWLDSVGANRLAVIRVVRDFTGLGLSEAQALVNAAPLRLATVEGLGQAEAFAAALADAGAQAHLNPTYGVGPAPIPLPPGAQGIVPDYGLLLDYRGDPGNPDLIFDLPLILGPLLPRQGDDDLDGLQFAVEIQDALGRDLYLLALPDAQALSEPATMGLLLLAALLGARPARRISTQHER